MQSKDIHAIPSVQSRAKTIKIKMKKKSCRSAAEKDRARNAWESEIKDDWTIENRKRIFSLAQIRYLRVW